MRIKAKQNGLTVHAIAGSYVVILGLNLTKTALKGCLGFAIERIDHTENERYWLKGFKTFQETDTSLPSGTLLSTLEQPIQAFQWSDFTAKPGYDYTYRVVPLYGKPKNLIQGTPVEVKVKTEGEDLGTHAIFFNRGIAGSQAYARKFKNQNPEQVGKPALDWLSRGLVEALEAFIGQAKNSKFSLRAALYEFHYDPIVETFAAASKAGADVKIVFDGRENSGNYPNLKNREAIERAGITALSIPREANRSYIAHNKFIILLKDGKPTQVWTGSTNITDGGLFGHSNVGHIVRDKTIAAAYLTYWEQLQTDTEAKLLRPWNTQNTPTPIGKPQKGIQPIFSPRSNLDVLNWYVEQMGTTKEALFFTAAFGVNDAIEEMFQTENDTLRYVLLEKDGGDVDILKRNPNNRIAVGGTVKDAIGNWQAEKVTGLNTHVKFIHTKYLLVDPLSETPLVITGSANFSDASTKNNDENMLVIQGDTHVADIYLGEFMRLFNHFYTRYLINQPGDQGGSIHLAADDSWSADYYIKDSAKSRERLYFS
jgi:phosphatidylserine/phosphatidylglycerophosphate/cardiolipin synthase-like enzyme